MDGESNSEPANAGPGAPTRVMALDLGDRRIGVAITDPLGYTAQPLMTIYRKTPRADLKSIARLVRKHAVGEVVVGKPLQMSGEAGPRAAKAMAFAELLRGQVAVPVYLFDERLTTWEAQQLLSQSAPGTGARGNRQRLDKKHIVDQVAAVLILEGFLQGREAQRARDAR